MVRPLRTLTGRPGGGDWPVLLEAGGRLALRQRAVASSAPLGTTSDDGGTNGHILDPATGMPAAVQWRSVSVSAPSAAVADALATAACLMPDVASIEALVDRFAGACLEYGG